MLLQDASLFSRHRECGAFYHPDSVEQKLMRIAGKKRFRQVRISGNEPTIGWEHLVKVLDLIDGRYLFILETNGILIGAHEAYAEDLSGSGNLHVRVSLKGTCGEEFSRLTGAFPEGFDLQIKALEHLVHHGEVPSGMHDKLQFTGEYQGIRKEAQGHSY